MSPLLPGTTVGCVLCVSAPQTLSLIATVIRDGFSFGIRLMMSYHNYYIITHTVRRPAFLLVLREHLWRSRLFKPDAVVAVVVYGAVVGPVQIRISRRKQLPSRTHALLKTFALYIYTCDSGGNHTLHRRRWYWDYASSKLLLLLLFCSSRVLYVGILSYKYTVYIENKKCLV